MVHIKKGFTAINVYSDLNPWIDSLFVVRDEQVDKAAKVLDEAFDEWFEDEDTVASYSEYLEDALERNGIQADTWFKSDDEFEDRYLKD